MASLPPPGMWSGRAVLTAKGEARGGPPRSYGGSWAQGSRRRADSGLANQVVSHRPPQTWDTPCGWAGRAVDGCIGEHSKGDRALARQAALGFLECWSRNSSVTIFQKGPSAWDTISGTEHAQEEWGSEGHEDGHSGTFSVQEPGG